MIRIVLILLFGCLAFFYAFYMSGNTLYDLKRYDLANRTTKRILLWTPFFSSRDYYFGIGVQPFREKCSLDAFLYPCEITVDKELINDSDAVLFHVRNLNEEMPSKRLPEQRWVFALMESPDNTGFNLNQFAPNTFNWTMTYRLDSDIQWFYGNYSPASSNIAKNETVWTPFERKSKLVAWLVSNCHTRIKREKYVEELRKYVPVDIYGKCGKKCSSAGLNSCSNIISRDYKFFLAFENSICKDYVTEKFYESLKWGAVPVINGGANYRAIAPPDSFIDARGFSSSKELAGYLQLLNSNDTLYMKYHSWRTEFEISNATNPFCSLCKKLHTDDGIKMYSNISAWWTGEGHCKLE